VAAQFGLPYAFAWFFTDGKGGPDSTRALPPALPAQFAPSGPHTALCVWALAAASAEEANYHFASRARVRLLRDRGIFAPLEAPEAALAHPTTDAERARLAEFQREAFVGSADEVVERIAALAQRLKVDEMVVVTWAYDEQARPAKLSAVG
jgi:alkanesulfonate monooxygenase SsuD/methylene tetrahydromethanopterin reductase-like flavin-dependent oxidoreductase (luciferase family)